MTTDKLEEGTPTKISPTGPAHRELPRPRLRARKRRERGAITLWLPNPLPIRTTADRGKFQPDSEVIPRRNQQSRDPARLDIGRNSVRRILKSRTSFD
jgi:hypothetical protein